jgi:hypothetical protein
MKHAWKYFEIHAKQRMSVFNFFVIMFGSFSAGLAATFQGPKKYSAVGVVIPTTRSKTDTCPIPATN